MTLTLTLTYDASPEVATFFAKVKAAQGHVTERRNDSRNNAIATFIAHVPEQPELIAYEKPHSRIGSEH